MAHAYLSSSESDFVDFRSEPTPLFHVLQQFSDSMGTKAELQAIERGDPRVIELSRHRGARGIGLPGAKPYEVFLWLDQLWGVFLAHQVVWLFGVHCFLNRVESASEVPRIGRIGHVFRIIFGESFPDLDEPTLAAAVRIHDFAKGLSLELGTNREAPDVHALHFLARMRQRADELKQLVDQFEASYRSRCATPTKGRQLAGLEWRRMRLFHLYRLKHVERHRSERLLEIYETGSDDLERTPMTKKRLEVELSRMRRELFADRELEQPLYLCAAYNRWIRETFESLGSERYSRFCAFETWAESEDNPLAELAQFDVWRFNVFIRGYSEGAGMDDFDAIADKSPMVEFGDSPSSQVTDPDS